MIAPSTSQPTSTCEIRLYTGQDWASRADRLEAYVLRQEPLALSRHPRWLSILAEGLKHHPYCLEAIDGERTCGLLPLAFVRSLLFGRFLVGLPYVNSGGVVADDARTAHLMIDRAVALADELGARYLELRHEEAIAHPSLTETRTDKVHMRLALPASAGSLWDALSPKVRNQVRKGQKGEFTTHWGGDELLPEFYDVFSRNMRDLGTPVFGRPLFRSILRHFPDRAEICVVRTGLRPVASALLLHGWGVTEVPSASSLREMNSACVNMLMYWQLLERAIERGQRVFDFGRSTRDGNTFRFKKQWGAEPHPANWQYYARSGGVGQLRNDNPKYGRMIRTWQRLPVWLTRLIGPPIVRGIP